jgi:hypothetical protein
MSAAIERGLLDAERQLLATLATHELASQTHCSIQLARDVLTEKATQGEILFVWDTQTVRVENLAGGWLVECARDWLAWNASFGGNEPS